MPSYPLFGSPIYLEDNRTLKISRDRMPRYVCAADELMVCECMTRLADCDCTC